jgi:hypothetical protein
MCDICDRARTTKPLKDALRVVAQAMQQRSNATRACLDDVIGELLGGKKGQDALDCETEPLKVRL